MEGFSSQQMLLTLLSSLGDTEARIEELRWVLNAGICKREKRSAIANKLARLHDTRRCLTEGINALAESPNGTQKHQSGHLERAEGTSATQRLKRWFDTAILRKH